VVGLNTSIDWSGGTTIEGRVHRSGCKIEARPYRRPDWIGHGSHICEAPRLCAAIV